jgi:hypothetical protein
MPGVDLELVHDLSQAGLHHGVGQHRLAPADQVRRRLAGSPQVLEPLQGELVGLGEELPLLSHALLARLLEGRLDQQQARSWSCDRGAHDEGSERGQGHRQQARDPGRAADPPAVRREPRAQEVRTQAGQGGEHEA